MKKARLDSAFENLRPISNLAYVSKLTERAVYNQIHEYMLQSGLYPLLQSAYRQYHSTDTALLKVTNNILLNMNSQRVTLLVLLDLSSAFDTVDHGILLKRLSSKFGIRGKVLNWFSTFLSWRSQRITLDGVISDKFDLNFGVPQSSCLGPSLFVTYVSTLFDIINNHLPDAHCFADDTQLYLSFKPDSCSIQDEVILAMENCICDLRKWMFEDKLKINDGKTELKKNVKFRIHFKILLLTFKTLHGMAPNYIRDLLTIRAQGRYSLRSKSSIVLDVPHGVKCYDYLEIAPLVWPLQSFGMNFLWQCVTFQHLVFLKGTSKRIFLS